jgi:hypothetical protein
MSAFVVSRLGQFLLDPAGVRPSAARRLPGLPKLPR